MSFITILLIGVGLSMDAFAVSLSACITWEGGREKNGLKLALFFGLFQAIMPTIGYYGGTYLSNYVEHFDHWIAFGLLLFVGGKMVKEAISQSKLEEQKAKEILTIKTVIILAVATSIDAFAVGLSLAFLKSPILWPAILIGSTTFVICYIGAHIGDKIGALLGRRVEIAGGFLLIAIGLKILYSHLSV